MSEEQQTGITTGEESTRRQRRRWPLYLAVAVTALLGSAGGLLFGLLQDLPEIRQLENYQPSATTRLLSADGKLLGSFYIERRIPVRLSQVPMVLRQAVVAIEDQNFYHHIGIDFEGIVRAVYADLRAGEFVQGASTITQQLARGLFLTPEKNLSRKLKEALLALQIERRYTKDEILERYLNQIYLGSGAYGVEAASQRYFGKSVGGGLTLAEAALIAGLPQYPSVYSPRANPRLAVKRRHSVLLNMHKRGFISKKQLLLADQEPIRLARPRPPEAGAPYFVESVRRLLEDKLGQNALYKGGLSIYTTLDTKMQAAAEEAVRTGMARLDERILKRYPESKTAPQVALVAIDPRNGEIRAMVGGRDYKVSCFNRALQSRRQPGSAFKPIVYSYAMEAGFTPSSLVLDAPLSLPGGANGAWRPVNYKHQYKGVITLTRALQTSQNTAAVRLLARLGVVPVIAHARRLGIQSPMGRDLSLALGSRGVTLCELTGAYAVFDDGGVRCPPTMIREVRDRRGLLVWRPDRTRQRVMSPRGAWMTTQMLRQVVQGGTAYKATELKRPCAGKTGTTSDFRDALFVGYSPELVAGVWVGFDSCRALGRGETGAQAALPVWMEFMRGALADIPVNDFQPPKYLEERTVPRAYVPTGQPAAQPAAQPEQPLPAAGTPTETEISG
ncbi:MAG: PBP1A family penicillin-binding protein [Pseudomonadota bacterium]